MTATFVTIPGLLENKERKYYACESFAMELGKHAATPTYCKAIRRNSCRST